MRFPINVPAPAPAPTPAVSRRCRALVVDDGVDSCDSLAAVIRMLGYDTAVAYDGREAVRVAAEFRPDLILMELSLPILSGQEAAAQIRAQDGGDNIMLIALTGWGRPNGEGLLAASGFHDHVIKPIDLDRLKTLLADVSAQLSPG